MKKLILLLLFVPLISYTQTWSYGENKSSFDGKYKAASIKGKGKFPYSPRLVINHFENTGKVNFYLTDAGPIYEKPLSDTIIYIKFNDDDAIYRTNSISTTENGENCFFDDFRTNTGLWISRKTMFERLKTASSLDLRIENEYRRDDFSFSLRGSTKAITYVLEAYGRTK